MTSAAIVGGEEIGLDQLQSEVDAILKERNGVDTSQMNLETGDVLTRSHLSLLIANRIVDEIAKDLEIEISKADLESYRVEIYATIGGEANLPRILVNAGIPRIALDKILRRELILRKISEAAKSIGADDETISQDIQKLVADKSTELKISVNPRYGKWDNTSLNVVDAEPTGDAVKTN